MPGILLPARFNKQRNGLRVNWEHPYFAGATKAVVIVGGQVQSFAKGHPTYNANAVAGTCRVSEGSRGTAWYGTDVGTRLNLSPVILSRTTGLFVIQQGGLRTKRDTNEYYFGWHYVSTGTIQFGSGAGTGSTHRRTYTYPGSNIAVCIRPASSISTAPTVYADGGLSTATYVSGTASSYGWGSTTDIYWEVGYDTANPTVNQNDRVVLAAFVNWDVPDGIMAEVSANPWGLFEQDDQFVYFEVGSATVSGTLAATESGADSAALAGKVLVEGALSASESGADTAALAGDVLVKGALAASESGNDSASFIGEGFVPTATGTLAASESGSDTASIAGKVYIAGTLSAVEGGLDGFAASGNILVQGTLAASETGDDTAAFVQETLTLTPADLNAIAAAMWADPAAVAAHAKLDEIIARITC